MLNPKSENENAKKHLGTFTFHIPNCVGDPYPDKSRLSFRHRGMQMGVRLVLCELERVRDGGRSRRGLRVSQVYVDDLRIRYVCVGLGGLVMFVCRRGGGDGRLCD